jgi:hypothetical protein
MSNQEIKVAPADLIRGILDALRNPTTNQQAERLLLLERQEDVIQAGIGIIPLLQMLAVYRGWGADCNRMIKQVERVSKGVHPLREVRPGEEPERKKIPGMPDGWRDPDGWRVQRDGVWKLAGDDEWSQVTCSPLWINRRFQDADNGIFHLELAWPGGVELVDRSVAMRSRELETLSKRGAPVTSVSSKYVVSYLDKAESRNAEVIPVAKSIQRLGWTMVDGKRAWQSPEGPHLLRAGGGHQQTVQNLAKKGTFEDWKKVTEAVIVHPIPALLLAASLASVTIEATGADPLVIDLSGQTSKGKSTATGFAASAWGNPSEKGGLPVSWALTLTALEQRAEFCQNIPVFLDDTKNCPEHDRGKIGTVIYGWGNGKPRGGVDTDHVRPVASWKSVLFSTGEAPAVLLGGQHSGARMRALSLVGQPFPDGAPAVRSIEGMTAWGHAGPWAAEWAMENWNELTGWWTKSRDDAEKRIGAGSSRLAGYIATVALGVRILKDMGFTVPIAEIRTLCDDAARFAIASADIPSEAFDRIVALITSNAGRITEQAGWEDKGPPPGGWIGRSLGLKGVAVIPSFLDAELERMGYAPQEVIPRWAKEKKCSDAPTNTRWMGRVVRMYHLTVGEGWTVSGVVDLPKDKGEPPLRDKPDPEENLW